MQTKKSSFHSILRRSSSARGLSLIEVLIVVAILSILVLAGMRNVVPQLSKARDGRRKADLDVIKVAMEEYFNDNGCYPPACALSSCQEELEPYLKRGVPKDPSGDRPYAYVAHPQYDSVLCADRDEGFQVFAALEKIDDSDVAALGCVGGCPGLSEEVLESVEAPGEPDEYVYGVSEGVPVGTGAASGCDQACPGANQWCIQPNGVDCNSESPPAGEKCSQVALNPPCGCPYPADTCSN